VAQPYKDRRYGSVDMQFHCYNFLYLWIWQTVLQEWPVRFQWVELFTVTCYALHPASVRIGKFKFIGKATQRAFEGSG